MEKRPVAQKDKPHRFAGAQSHERRLSDASSRRPCTRQALSPAPMNADWQLNSLYRLRLRQTKYSLEKRSSTFSFVRIAPDRDSRKAWDAAERRLPRVSREAPIFRHACLRSALLPSATAINTEVHFARITATHHAAVRAYARCCGLSGPVRSDTRETPLHRHRSGISETWRPCRLRDRGPRSVGRRARSQLDVRSREAVIFIRRRTLGRFANKSTVSGGRVRAQRY